MYIGSQPLFGTYEKLDDISSGFNGVTTAFECTVDSIATPIASVNHLIVVKNGLILDPGIDYVVGSNGHSIIFTSAPLITDAVNIRVFGHVFDIPSVANGTVTTSKIVDANVTLNKLAPNSVNSSKIVDANVTTNKLASNSVTTDKLAPNSVVGSKILDGSIITTKIANGAVTGDKLDPSLETLIDGAVQTGALIANPIVHLQHQEASGTSGGASVAGARRTITLNQKVTDTLDIPGLSSNQFTLPAGTYRVRGFKEFYATLNCKVWIRNITDSTDAVIGSSGYTRNDTTNNVQASATVPICGQFTITSTKTFEFQYQTVGSRTNTGLGVATGLGTEIYADLFIEKVA